MTDAFCYRVCNSVWAFNNFWPIVFVARFSSRRRMEIAHQNRTKWQSSKCSYVRDIRRPTRTHALFLVFRFAETRRRGDNDKCQECDEIVCVTFTRLFTWPVRAIWVSLNFFLFSLIHFCNSNRHDGKNIILHGVRFIGSKQQKPPQKVTLRSRCGGIGKSQRAVCLWLRLFLICFFYFFIFCVHFLPVGRRLLNGHAK